MMQLPSGPRGPLMLRLRSSFASVPLALFLAACSHATQAGGDGGLVTPEGRRLVDERAIEQSGARTAWDALRSEEHTSELQSRLHLVCRLLLEKKKLVERRYSIRLDCTT